MFYHPFQKPKHFQNAQSFLNFSHLPKAIIKLIKVAKFNKQLNTLLFTILLFSFNCFAAESLPQLNVANNSIKTVSPPSTNINTDKNTNENRNKNINTILVLGDSLSAEYGLVKQTGWVNLIQKKLVDENLPYTVYNASISGETTSGGASRIQALTKQLKPKIVVIELGANDALRGVPLATTKANLESIIQAAKQIHARVLLIGMQLPPNYGQAYNNQFTQTFKTLSKQFQVAFIPFLLESIADNLNYFQADQIHPNESAQTHIVQAVWPGFYALINK